MPLFSDFQISSLWIFSPHNRLWGRLVPLVLLATTSVTKQRQISCQFYTQAKYRERKYYPVHHAGLQHYFFSGGGGEGGGGVEDTDDEGQWEENTVVETKSLCVVEQAYQKLREEKNRFSQSFDIWTQSSIQSCFHTFIHQTFTVFPNSQSKTFSIFVAPSKNMSHYLVWDIPPPTTSSSRWQYGNWEKILSLLFTRNWQKFKYQNK